MLYKGSELSVGIAGLMIALSIIVIFLRFLSRYMSGNKFGWDDWLALLAFPVCVATNALTIYTDSDHGDTGTHEWEILQTTDVYVKQTLYYVAMTAIKLSVLFFYRRIFSSNDRRFKWVLIITGAIILLRATPTMLVQMFKCTPVRGAWDKTIESKCIDDKNIYLAQSIPNIIEDLVILVIPMKFLWRLHVRPAQKVALVIVFALGYFVPIVAIIRQVKTVQAVQLLESMQGNPYTSTTAQSLFVPIAIWTVSEPPLALISCCVPTMHYLFSLLYKKLSGKEAGYSSGSRRAGAASSGFRAHDNGKSQKSGMVSASGTGNFSRLDHDELMDKKPYSITVIGSGRLHSSGSREQDDDSVPLQPLPKQPTNFDYV